MKAFGGHDLASESEMKCHGCWMLTASLNIITPYVVFYSSQSSFPTFSHLLFAMVAGYRQKGCY